jgi:protein-arginine kinase activator protein McsA
MAELTEKELEAALEGMSDEGKQLLMSLLTVEKKGSPRKKRVKVEPLTPHNLVYTITCELCGATHEQFFEMVTNGRLECLVGKQVHVKPAVYQENKQVAKWCGKCEAFLSSLTKEELVAKVLKVVKGGG